MPFRSALTKTDLMTNATLALVAGQFNKVGERVIQAGEAISIGFGEQSGQESAQGRIHMNLRSTTAAIPGKVRLQVYSPQNRPMQILGEWRTEALATGIDDRTKQVPLPEDQFLITEDKKIVLEFLPDAAATLDRNSSTILVDTTEEEV